MLPDRPSRSAPSPVESDVESDVDSPVEKGPDRPPGAPPGAAERFPKAALAVLIDDESPLVWRAVRAEFRRLGRRAVPLLWRLARGSDRPRARGRARGLLAERDRERAERRLARFACGDALDLERGLFLLVRLQEARFDARPYLKTLDRLADRVRKSASAESGGLAAALCRVLGTELRYGGALPDYHHPDNLHLHRALERHRGLPLTLTAIWLFVARRVGLRAAALPLPGHVMLRLYSGPGTEPLIVDPFDYGRLRTERECLQYLTRHGLEFRPEWFRDADDRTMFRRQLANLARSHELRRLPRELRGVQRILGILDESPARSAPRGARLA